MTKWKMAGFSLLVAGALASGAMVSAQVPGPPTYASDSEVSAQVPGPPSSISDSERLKALEAKLDRIVRVLEGIHQAPADKPAAHDPNSTPANSLNHAAADIAPADPPATLGPV
jgi:hypothetical protein